MKIVPFRQIAVMAAFLLSAISVIGCTPLAMTMVGIPSKMDDSPIASAVKKGDIEEVKRELNKGVDINSRCDHGATILMTAIDMEHNDIATMLIEKGADVNAKEPFMEGTALMGAVQKGNSEIVRLLLDKGADVKAKTTLGYTVLFNSSSSTNINVFKQTIDRGADVNASNYKGSTPLMDAAEVGRMDIIKLLVSKGADINHKDDKGNTALMEAIFMGRTEVVSFLLDNGADITDGKLILNQVLDMLAERKLTKDGARKIIAALTQKGITLGHPILVIMDNLIVSRNPSVHVPIDFIGTFITGFPVFSARHKNIVELEGTETLYAKYRSPLERGTNEVSRQVTDWTEFRLNAKMNELYWLSYDLDPKENLVKIKLDKL